MALMNDPELVIFDEPLAGVSSHDLTNIINHLTSLQESGVSILLAEHRIKRVIRLADKAFELKLGKLSNYRFNNTDEIVGEMR